MGERKRVKRGLIMLRWKSMELEQMQAYQCTSTTYAKGILSRYLLTLDLLLVSFFFSFSFSFFLCSLPFIFFLI